jgi:hypothetical protein
MPDGSAAYAAVGAASTPAAATPFASARGQQAQSPEHLTVAWSMMRRIVRAHRPHWALQPRQPYIWLVMRGPFARKTARI